MQNVIHKLTLDLSFPSDSEDIYTINTIIDTDYKEKIIIIIKQEVEAFSTEQQIVIEKIEIELKNYNSIELILVELKTQLKAELAKHLSNKKVETSLLKNLNRTNIAYDELQLIWSFDNFTFYLKTGTYVWDSQKTTTNKVNFTELLKTYLKLNVSTLTTLFINHPITFKRFIISFSPHFKYFCKEILGTNRYFSAEIETIFTSLNKLPAQKIIAFDNLIIYKLFKTIESESEVDSVLTILLGLQLLSPKHSSLFNELVLMALLFKQSGSDIKTKYKQYNTNGHNKIKTEISKLLRVSEGVNIGLSQEFINLLFQVFSVNEQNITSENNNKLETKFPAFVEQKLELPGSLFTNHAGLILLHPFLEHLFKECGLTNGDSFKNFNSQFKAIQLLNYLATFNTKLDFDNTPIFNILCGLHPYDMVYFSVSLTKSQKKKCKDLLVQAISYWEILKNTSPGALQLDFIQRSGSLRIEKNQYVLDVEQKSIDILLQRIPWTTSMLKLPWMEKLLIVNW